MKPFLNVLRKLHLEGLEIGSSIVPSIQLLAVSIPKHGVRFKTLNNLMVMRAVAIAYTQDIKLPVPKSSMGLSKMCSYEIIWIH